MPARLFCEIGELAGSDFLIDQEATIGRLQQNEITLHPTFISGHHARIYFDAEEKSYVLEDLGSSNGTALDGMAVTEPTRLDRLHVITFADQFDFIFQTVSEALARRIAATSPSALREEGEKTRMGDAFLPLPPLVAPSPGEGSEAPHTGDASGATPPHDGEQAADPLEKTHIGAFFGDLPPLSSEQDPIEKTRIEDAFTAPPPLTAPDTDAGADEPVADTGPSPEPTAFELDVSMPDGTRQVFSLTEGTHLIGRESTCAIALPDPSISRDHALLTVHGEQARLQDLGSKNGTFVDGEKVTGEVAILPGGTLGFGLEITAYLRRRP